MNATSLIIFALCCSLGAAQTPAHDSSDSAVERELVHIAQRLFDAVAVGDKSVWEQYVADDALYTDENWNVLTKKQLIESLAPLPRGYSGSIRMADIQSRIMGDAAVLKYRALEEEYVFEQKLNVVYLATDTYFKRGGRWQLVASHISVKPGERKPITLDKESRRSMVGEYELTPGVTYAVTLEGDTLIGQRTGRAKEVLLSADVNTFFPRGSLRNEKVFVHDSTGRTIEMLDRRENNDLVWKKIR